jgi:hypothetical protein
MRKNDGMQQNNYNSLSGNNGLIGEIDDLTFNQWKSELQKELPSFWQSMKRF